MPPRLPLVTVTTSTGAIAIADMLSASAATQAMYAAVRLGIPDVLAAGPASAPHVAAGVAADPESTHRLLRALVAAGVCEQREGHTFALTGVGDQLRTGVEGSMRAYVLHWAGSMWPVWAQLFHHVKTGSNPRALVTRRSPFESLAGRPGSEQVFHQAMSEMAALAGASIVEAYTFSPGSVVVDVGGGQGALIASVLASTPGLRGVLFDQASAVEGAERALGARGVIDRCDVVVGNFFDQVPQNGDVYLLKSVLHDWDDTAAGAILNRIAGAMSDEARLLIVERVLPDQLSTSARDRVAVGSDILMMLAAGGRERTVTEFDGLLESAGLRRLRIIETPMHYSIIEAGRG